MNNSITEGERALRVLKNEGEKTIKEMAEELEITVEGARFQLLRLANEGFVKSENRSKGRGRPRQIWSLTKKGHGRFPDAHSGLTVKIIEKIRENFGEDSLDKIISSTGKDNISKYRQHIREQDPLEKKVGILAEIRNDEGYMATYKKKEDGSFLLIENHCPICAAAEVCQGFCKAELNTFQEVLGASIKVKRIDHILQGARRCAYLIQN